MAELRIGINGVGRVGRNILRAAEQGFAGQARVVAMNDLVDAAAIAAALPRDSTYGRFPAEVEHIGGDRIRIGGAEVAVHHEEDARRVPWADHGVDVVMECSRFYLSSEKARVHLEAGARGVILSAPAKDDTPTVVLGVNHDTLGGTAIVSNASCTTNCLAPLARAVDESFGIVSGLISTTHAATTDQKIADGFGGTKDRALLNNILPVTTGAAQAIGRVLPHLQGRLSGSALRVPTTTGSVLEAVFLIQGEPSAGEVLTSLEEQARGINASTPSGRILYVGSEYQCSMDCVGASWSSMVYADNAMVVRCRDTCGLSLLKLTSFYDNEMGFSHRMVEMGLLMAG